MFTNSFIAIFLLLFVSLAEARDPVTRDLVSQPRSLRSAIIENPEPPPPPGGGGGGSEPPPASDVRGGENVLTLVYTETVPTGSNRLLVIPVCHRSFADDITSIVSSVDGAFTKHASSQYQVSNIRADLWRLIAPTEGEHTITVTFPTARNAAAGAIHLNGVHQTVPLGSVTTSQGSGDASTMISSNTERVVLDHICMSLPNELVGGVTPGTGQGQVSFTTAGINASVTNRVGATSLKAGATSVTMAWAKPAANNFMHQVVEVLPLVDEPEEPPPTPCANCYILNKNFEDSSFTSGSVELATCCENGDTQEIVATPVRTGTKAAKIRLRYPYDPETDFRATCPSWLCNNSSPSGVMVRAEMDRFGLGSSHGDTERWYGFSVYIDSTWVDTTNDPNGTVISQWKTNKDACDVSQSPHLSLRLTRDLRWRVAKHHDANPCGTIASPNQVLYDLGAVTKGQWYDFVVYKKGSYTASGALKVWMNTTLVIDFTGPTAYNDAQQEFHNIGIYKSWWNVTLPSPLPMTPHVAYFDNWRIANALGCFAAVDPSQATPGGC